MVRLSLIALAGVLLFSTQAAGDIVVTVQTVPPGCSFKVDGVSYVGSQTFLWLPGMGHGIAVISPQSGSPGTQYVWDSWSNGGPMTQTVYPVTDTIYTANFATQFLLTTTASPPGGGTVGPASGYYNSGQTVSLSASPSNGFLFTGWAGTGTGSYTGSNPSGSVTMNGPITETASFTNVVSVTVQSNLAGRSFSVDGTSYTTAQSFAWASGSQHTISTTSPQSGGGGTQYVWSNWSDGGAISHTITASNGAVYTANFATQFLLTTAASPPSGGTVGPASGYYNSGQTVSLSASPNSGFLFTGWAGTGTGAYTGSNPSGSVTMNGPITETANFTNTIYVATDGYCSGKIPCSRHIQDGIESASDPATIEITEETYDEDINLNSGQEIALWGGWDTSFTSNSSFTTIQGSITITNGTIIPENIIVK